MRPVATDVAHSVVCVDMQLGGGDSCDPDPQENATIGGGAHVPAHTAWRMCLPSACVADECIRAATVDKTAMRPLAKLLWTYFTHAAIAAGVGRAFRRVCLSVCSPANRKTA